MLLNPRCFNTISNAFNRAEGCVHTQDVRRVCSSIVFLRCHPIATSFLNHNGHAKRNTLSQMGNNMIRVANLDIGRHRKITSFNLTCLINRQPHFSAITLMQD